MSNVADVRDQDVEVELSGTVYTLNFDLNAMALIEDEHGDVDTIMEKIASGSPKATIALLWAGLNRHHPELTKMQVGSIAGFRDIAKIAKAIYGGVESALPQQRAGRRKN